MTVVDTSTRPRVTKWKILVTGLTTLADDNWAEDVSDALPADSRRNWSNFYFDQSIGKPVAIEFVVLAYVAATGLLVDLAAETFSVEPYFFNQPPSGSNVVGRTSTDEKIATRGETLTGCHFNKHYRFDCDGADDWTLRLHTLSGAPTGADRYEVWYREVVE